MINIKKFKELLKLLRKLPEEKFPELYNFLKMFPEKKEKIMMEDPKFGKWLVSIIFFYFILPLGIILTVSKILGILPELSSIKIPESLKEIETICFFCILIQFVVIFIVTLFQVKPRLFSEKDIEKCTSKKENEKEIKEENVEDEMKDYYKACGYDNYGGWCDAKEIANKALLDYKQKWYYIWVSWLLFYVVLALRFAPEELIKHSDLYNSIIRFVLNLSNNITTLLFIFCYKVLNKITVPSKHKKLSDNSDYIPWIAIFFVFTLLDGFTGSKFLEAKIDPFQLVSGIVAGVVMAVFIGRFDSKFIKAPLLLLISLYCYAVIQALFFIFDEPTETLIIINVALIFKVLLFLFMTWLFKTGKFLFYFVRIRKLHEDVDVDFKKFLTFFHVYDENKKNELKY